jgi:hypothetical protein
MIESSTMHEIGTGSRRTFTERGEHELKGVPGQWRLYALVKAQTTVRRGRLAAVAAVAAIARSRTHTAGATIVPVLLAVATLTLIGKDATGVRFGTAESTFLPTEVT